MECPFTEHDSHKAYEEWGADCGPNALAFVLGIKLDLVRHLIPDFEKKRYTSPSMMRLGCVFGALKIQEAVLKMGDIDISKGAMFHELPALVRIQWDGPWTASPKTRNAAYAHTHWVATWKDDKRYVFDVNGGIMPVQDWVRKIVPMLTSQIERANGEWYPTHVWRIVSKGIPTPPPPSRLSAIA